MDNKQEASGAISRGKELKKIKEEQKRLSDIMALMGVVLFVGFFGGAVAIGGIVVDAFRSREASYNDLVKEVRAKDTEIDAIKKGLQHNYIIPQD